MASTIPTRFSFKLYHFGQTTIRSTPTVFIFPNTKLPRSSLLARACSDGGGSIDATPQQRSLPSNTKEISRESNTGEGYVGLFVRMLGLDHDPLDREQAVVALWKYSLGGRKCIDTIMQFHGCLNLIINLLKSNSSSASEAAAGLLRSISSVNVYRKCVAEAGAIEEITGLLSHTSLAPEVKEQCLCALSNLSVDEDLRRKIADPDTLVLLINSLNDEDLKVKEAVGGVLATLALSQSNHNVMVELGVIPKLAEFLDAEGSKILRKEARSALLELVKDEYYRILIIEEGLLPVPVVGSAAYKSFRPYLHSWPSLPDGTEIEQTSKGPSRFGASELLLGLNMNDSKMDIEEAKMNAIVGRTQQQFLARIGAIELEDQRKSQPDFCTNRKLTLLPCMDGVARLVLILELEDESAIARAAESIADASISEYMRKSFKEAGAIKHLARLLEHDNDTIRMAVANALDKLSLSHAVCQTIEAEGVVRTLINTLKHREVSDILAERILNTLSRILDPTKEMKLKFYDGPVNGSTKSFEELRSHHPFDVPTKATADTSIPRDFRNDVLEPSFISRLVAIMKTSSSNLQRKIASILEYVAIVSVSLDPLFSAEIESGLTAVFQQRILTDMASDMEGEQPEQYFVLIEEAGQAISAASRLLTKLLDSDEFCRRVDPGRFTALLRGILKSNIPVNCKDWVAACLVKLTSLSGPTKDFESPINMEVTLYETIPRLIEQLKSSPSSEEQEGAVIELNRIISEGLVDSTRVVATGGGIFALVKLLEEGNQNAANAALSILYNLSMDSENHLAIIAAGAVPVLRRIVLSQQPQWTRALRLLRILPV